MTKDWMTFYYVEPQPERFVEEVRSLAAQGILAYPERAFPAVVFSESCHGRESIQGAQLGRHAVGSFRPPTGEA